MGRPKGSKNKKRKEDRQIFVEPVSNMLKKQKQTSKREYQKTEAGQLLQMHRSRGTGALVAVLRGPAELGIGSGAKWLTMCLAHHEFSVYDARVRAQAESNKSAEWCKSCAAMSNKKSKQTA